MPAIAYSVPGLVPVIAQPTSMVCWATVHAMMRSWRDRMSHDIRGAAELVHPQYATMVDNNQGMPPVKFGPFIRQAGMRFEPMANLPAEEWLRKLRAHGLLWVGTMASVRGGLHSRIIAGMRGDGTSTGTWMYMVDPAGGRRYRERFDLFTTKYEGAIRGRSGPYFQIRHF